MSAGELWPRRARRPSGRPPLAAPLAKRLVRRRVDHAPKERAPGGRIEQTEPPLAHCASAYSLSTLEPTPPAVSGLGGAGVAGFVVPSAGNLGRLAVVASVGRRLRCGFAAVACLALRPLREQLAAHSTICVASHCMRCRHAPCRVGFGTVLGSRDAALRFGLRLAHPFSKATTAPWGPRVRRAVRTRMRASGRACGQLRAERAVEVATTASGRRARCRARPPRRSSSL